MAKEKVTVKVVKTYWESIDKDNLIKGEFRTYLKKIVDGLYEGSTEREIRLVYTTLKTKADTGIFQFALRVLKRLILSEFGINLR